MWTRGFHAVGLNEILKAVGVPKGSFYHYFKSKEDFGVEMLNYYIAATSEQKRTMLTPETCDGEPLMRLVDMMEDSIDKFIANDRKYPCLVLKLASEVTDLSEPMRKTLEEGMNNWMSLISGALEEAKRLGQISQDVDAEFEAGIYRDLWAGAIQRATICKSSQPMHAAFKAITDHFAVLRAAAENTPASAE
eukprot:g3691.t1